jgi:hypothetical protein
MSSRHPLRLALLLAIAALAITPTSALAAYGLAGEWLLDDAGGTLARETSGAGLDGQFAAGTGAPTRIVGIEGFALHFDGDDEVSMPDSPNLEPSRLTVEAWVRNAGTPGQFRYVVAKGADACRLSSYGVYTGTSGGLAFYVSGPTGFVVSAQALPSAVWDGHWHHVAGTYDGDTVRLFVDGAEIGTGRPAPASIAYGLPSKGLRLGTYRGGCVLPYIGDIDTVRIWNLALTSEEVAAAPASPFLRPEIDPATPRPGTPGAGAGAGGNGSAACLTVSPNTRRVRVGRRTTLTLTVRKGGTRAVRVRVVLSGKGLRSMVRRTDRLGRARFVVRARRRATLQMRAYGTTAKCRPPIVKVSAR